MQNPTTFESVESLMFLIDINNVPIENTEDKYLSKDNYKEFFIEMQKILDSKREYIFELMEGNSNV